MSSAELLFSSEDLERLEREILQNENQNFLMQSEQSIVEWRVEDEQTILRISPSGGL